MRCKNYKGNVHRLARGDECQEKRLYKHFTESETTIFNMNVFIILVEQADSFRPPRRDDYQ